MTIAAAILALLTLPSGHGVAACRPRCADHAEALAHAPNLLTLVRLAHALEWTVAELVAAGERIAARDEAALGEVGT